MSVLLIGFVLVSSLVIWRRSYGLTLSRDLVNLDHRREELEGEEARLHGEIRDESSRSKLDPAIQRLGMHIPGDEQMRRLPR